jgi:hypothetical protein
VQKLVEGRAGRAGKAAAVSVIHGYASRFPPRTQRKNDVPRRKLNAEPHLVIHRSAPEATSSTLQEA